MNAVPILVLFLAASAMDAADAYALELHQKRQALALRVAKLLAQGDAQRAKTEALLEKSRESARESETYWERVTEERRMVAARKAGEPDRVARSAHKGDEARRAAEGRCTGTESPPRTWPEWVPPARILPKADAREK